MGGFMPTVKGIAGPYRLYFYSFDCHEPMHVHVQREHRICKFWLEPLALAGNNKFSAREIGTIRRHIDSHRSKVMEAWNEHCG